MGWIGDRVEGKGLVSKSKLKLELGLMLELVGVLHSAFKE